MNPFAILGRAALAASLAALAATALQASEPSGEFIPRRQSRPPGPPLQPAEAIRRMTVPDGFAVELFAAEPDLVNPVAMTFDERGRVWVTESVEYPRQEAGPGRDRVRILADTDGDGRADRVTTFLDGLAIPSGIAVGHGGVWIVNAPDLLFVRDDDGDGVADHREVVVTGFGRHDTHELPNSLTWGPDGWLYGLNGVFNPAHVRYPPENPNHRPDHPGWTFDCGMFRVHPRTREFEVVCEGTSNPWGIAFDPEGEAFVSACVIDHLWHLVEGGNYIRQAGPPPPHAWQLGSIVNHKHQAAAYCGITWFDSDAYPEAYRRRLFMGNIHGGCINVDRVTGAGSTYRGLPEPDFLTANDVWFMPVVQKTGPDGCLWILDWYDRYHCYQDARADPAGIDRQRGRLYRVTHRDGPATGPPDLAASTDAGLVELLGHPNVWIRETAQRLIGERSREPVARLLLDRLRQPGVGDEPVRLRHALFALLGCDLAAMGSLHEELVRSLGSHADPFCRAWAIRAARLPGRPGPPDPRLLIRGLADEAPQVRLRAAIAIGSEALRTEDGLDDAALAACEEPLVESLLGQADDLHHARFVWRALEAIWRRGIGTRADGLLPATVVAGPAGAALAGRILDWQLGRGELDGRLLGARLAAELASAEGGLLPNRLVGEIRAGRLAGPRLTRAAGWLAAAVAPARADPASPHHVTALLLAAACGDPEAAGLVARLDAERRPESLLDGLAALVAAGSPRAGEAAARALAGAFPAAVQAEVLAVLARGDDPGTAEIVIAALAGLDPATRPRALDLLTQRADRARALIEAVAGGRLEPPELDANQLRRLAALDDPELAAVVRDRWGTVREGRNPDRERVVAGMRSLAASTPGEPARGAEVFARVCSSCHRLHGRGAEVGPDITSNGRGSFDQLLSNVFDPSLVIGPAYQSWTVLTAAGRVVTGLLVEDTPDRLVLRVPGGTAETIPREEIEDFRRNETSLMPEGIERQCSPQELADLLAYLALDLPPEDPRARPIPGAPAR